MSVGKGSIKRAVGATQAKITEEKKPVAKVAEQKKVAPKKSAPTKKATPKKTAEKKAAEKSVEKKQTLPVSNSTAGKNFGVGDELPIFLM